MRYLPLALGLTSWMLLCTQSAAHAEPWKLEWNLDLTLTESAYSNNWEGGESGQMTWTINSNTLAEKAMGDIFNKNTLIMQYGVTYTQDAATNDWGVGDNTTDRIDLESTFRWMTGGWVEPILAFRGITAFRDESDPFKARWLNPMQLTESLGGSHLFFKEETREWQTRVGAAAKQTIDRDALMDATDPQSARDTMTKHESGVELVNDIKLPLAEGRIVWTSKLALFQALMSSAKDDTAGTPAADYWKHTDVNFENTFVSNITKYIAVNLYVQLRYDREVAAGARFKQTLSLALTYKLM